MISKYKLNIIYWYTGLLTFVLVLIFGLLLSILKLQLRKEINTNLSEKIEWIDRVLRDTEEPPSPRRGFLDYIVGRRYYDFYDVREHTDVVDEKYLLFVYCSDRLMYSSEYYQDLEPHLRRYELESNAIHTIEILDKQFSMKAIYKVGYTVYVGYELSRIHSLQSKILIIFLIMFPFAVLLSVLCGYFVTQRSLKVINTIDRTAARITSKNLKERIALPGGRDEVTHLIVTLNSMIDRLEKSFTMAQQFSQDAAHEIRTPLTVVRAEIESMLEKNACPSDITKSMESILEEIQYLSSIANKLLLIHSLDTSEIEYNFTEVHLSGLLRDTFEDAQVLAADKGISVELKYSEDVVLQGNGELLIRLFWNIIDNAIKYTPEKGRVTISLATEENNAVLAVTDTGIGIAKKELSSIFDRFYRIDKSRSRELGGSGLGLSISKWIVELHHGTIEVTSALGKGSTFTIILPLYTI